MPNTAELPATELDEQGLIDRAQSAVSRCNWDVGECAALWTKRFSRGRTDADFAQLVQLSPDQVYQRRRVWETFADIYHTYPGLKWSHFYAAINWDDAAECLQWAQEIEATVAEMRAWRKAQRGEDLGGDSREEMVGLLPTEPSPVRIPGMASLDEAPFDADEPGATRTDSRYADELALSGVARTAEGQEAEYTPFRSGAAPTPGKKSADDQDIDTIIRRIAHTIEKSANLLTDETLKQARHASQEMKDRLQAAVEGLNARMERFR
jgi:hypothetical protein